MFDFPTMEVPVPTIEEVGLMEYESLLLERQTLKSLMEEMETKITKLDEEIGQVLDEKDVKSFVWQDYLVIRRQGSKPRPSLDRILLLEAGVSPQQLKAGTKFGEPGKPGVTIRALSKTKAKGLEEYTRE